MTYIECFLIISAFGLGIVGLFGVGYPLAMVIWYKLTGSELSVREILRRI